MERFVLLIKKHKFFGYIFIPYFVIHEKKEEKYTISRRILPGHPDAEADRLPEIYRKIIRITGEYDDRVVKKLFHKDPRINLKEFFRTLEQKRIDQFIRPYIEKRLVEIVRLLKNTDIEIFLHETSSPGIYHEDRVVINQSDLFAIFHFHKREEGTEYFISLKREGERVILKDRKHIILVNKPCVLIMEGRLYLLENIEGKKLQPFFTKERIHIPVKLEKKYYQTFIREALMHYETEVSGFDISERHPAPVPELTLEPGMKGLLVLVLLFRYGGLQISINRNQEVFVTLEEKNGNFSFTRIFRDRGLENRSVERLKELGFVEDMPGIFLPGKESGDPAGQQYKMVNFINRKRDELKKAGFVLHRKTDKKYLLDTINIEIKSKAHHRKDGLLDWIGLHAEVRFGSYRIPFIRLKDHILNGIREYELPDGSIAVIPEEWFAEYEDLLQFGEVDGEEIHVRKHHLPLLEKKQGLENDREIRQRISAMLETGGKAYPLPEDFRAEMRPYQRIGYGWMMNLRKHGFGGCLADDMGLGKTIQSIALIQKISEQGEKKKEYSFTYTSNRKAGEAVQLSLFDGISEPAEGETEKGAVSLVVVPKSLVFNWVEEINRFAPGLRILVYAGSGREHYFDYFDMYDVVLVTYGLLRKDIDLFVRIPFDLVILDESRYIKNPDSMIFKAVIRLRGEQRMVLTGTPVENSLTDLWAQMEFINPGLLGSFRFFQEKFVIPIEKQQDKKALNKLRLMIQPFLLRRTKQEVATDLPDISVQRIYTEMSADQSRFYEEEKSKVRNAVLKLINEGRSSKLMIPVLQGLTRLRLAANHPVLVDKNYLGDSGKFEEVIEMIRTITSEKHKILVFSSFVKVLRVYETQLKEEGIPYVMLTGGTSQKMRKEMVKRFQEDENIPVFLVSVMAGGFGLNLIAADYVMILDPWWNPAVEQQAIDRTHRIGQTRKVMVYKIISRDSIEEKIMQYQQKKARLAADILETEESLLKQLGKEELTELFQ